ncbi:MULTISPECIES: DsbA family protein [Chromobacterium]|uniref:DsbA family protein n=1 Tax=Chromobacterium TaxID=535 RepID=UPI000D311E3B|nr:MULTISPECIES: DsbA family protein [Chromobacterium]PTU64433.1 protein-disulfide isomerase [Chromobacterium sp. Panama]UJB29793.1 DsbA family protein [Chromobacterium sp. Beijing]
MVSASTIRLHYFYDPLCGWCYGASPLLLAAAARPEVELALHGGGMLSAPHNRRVNLEWRGYVMPHDHRIAALSGQPFGDAYFDGLLRSEARLDSTPPIAAVLAAPELGIAPQTMLARVQAAHYLHGLEIADVAVLARLAAELGVSADRFADAYAGGLARSVEHIDHSRRLMTRLGLRGFPSAALEVDGRFQALDLGSYLGKPDMFSQHLAQLGAATLSGSAELPPMCGLDGC